MKLKKTTTSTLVILLALSFAQSSWAVGVSGLATENPSHENPFHENPSHENNGHDNEGSGEKSLDNDEHEGGHKDDQSSGHEGRDDQNNDLNEISEETHEEGITLGETQMSMAGINVETLHPRTMDYQIYTPGEIVANGYTSYLVSPRVDSVVLRRHVALGDHVVQDQRLVTLFSETVATAQANYQVNAAEWRRVQRLGQKAVGAKRFISAQTNFNAANARLQAYGLSASAISSLTNSQASNQTGNKATNENATILGEYTLNAATGGVVLSDDFQQGQHLAAGSSLMMIANEHELWVEAKLAPTQQLQLPAGTIAKVKVGGEFFSATVTQQAHTIDLLTRTRVVRLLVSNTSHRLHPGLFADVYFQFSTEQAVLAVPEAALVRGADGDWTVFTEDHPGEFKAEEVELGRSLGDWREIKGISAGTRVVTGGAFFVASQIAKGGFDPHNH